MVPYDYIDLGTDYGKIIERIPEDDEYLKRAASICDGIRIIKQDPWDCYWNAYRSSWQCNGEL